MLSLVTMDIMELMGLVQDVIPLVLNALQEVLIVVVPA